MAAVSDMVNSVGSKVLLVDDDPAMLRILSKWLQSAGYAVQAAEDGVQALASIVADCPDFLITDWEMPRMNGLELCRRARELALPHYVYILFLTVKSAPAEMIEGLEGGADDFLSKPVYQGELLARMRAGRRVLQLERRLVQMAHTDPLTGLMTQRTFYDLLEQHWQRASQFQLPLSCVMLNLDGFRQANDVYGHPVGDSILKSVADLLVDQSRAGDVLCRYAGDEFGALLPETDESEAARWAEQVRQRLASLATALDNGEVRITGTLAVAGMDDDARTSEELVGLAEKALRCAKQSGRDRVVRCTTSADRGQTVEP